MVALTLKGTILQINSGTAAAFKAVDMESNSKEKNTFSLDSKRMR